MDNGPWRPWLPAAIIGVAIVIAAGLVAGALILKSRPFNSVTTCDAWKQTRLNLLAVPGLPDGWAWNTPNIDTAIGLQTAAVGNALDVFEKQISPEPARQYESTVPAGRNSSSANPMSPRIDVIADRAISRIAPTGPD